MYILLVIELTDLVFCILNQQTNHVYRLSGFRYIYNIFPLLVNLETFLCETKDAVNGMFIALF